MSDELRYQDHPADPKSYLPQQHWTYEVRPDRGRFRARQLLNGSVLKSTWRETEEEAQQLCKDWERARGQGRVGHSAYPVKGDMK